MTDGDVGHGGGIGEMHQTWRQRRNEAWVHEPLAPRYPRTISRVEGKLESKVAWFLRLQRFMILLPE